MDKQKELEKKVIETCEDLGWWVNVYAEKFENRFFEIGRLSPLGEDFSFDAWGDSIIQDIKEYASNFDADEHAENISRMRGSPKSIRAFLADADEIQEMLYQLANAVVKIEVE